MSILAFLFIGGLTLKGMLILAKVSIDRLSLRYHAKIFSLPVHVEPVEFKLGIQMETEVVSNSSKSMGEQIYMSASIQKTFSA